MTDETGVPGKPFIGKDGKPRKTRPKGQKKAQDSAVVTELFSDERQKAPGIRSPLSDVKKKKRKRIQIGTGWANALERMENEGITMAEFVKELSPEELARGRLKNADGSFRGAPTKWVPAEFHKECIRELMRRGKELYQVNYIEAIQSMTLIANSPSVEPAQRIKAAQFVIERIEGKVPERLEVGVSEPWQEILTGIVATVDPAAVPMRKFREGEAEAEDDEVGDDD
jgi:hypothetical protein